MSRRCVIKFRWQILARLLELLAISVQALIRSIAVFRKAECRPLQAECYVTDLPDVFFNRLLTHHSECAQKCLSPCGVFCGGRRYGWRSGDRCGSIVNAGDPLVVESALECVVDLRKKVQSERTMD